MFNASNGNISTFTLTAEPPRSFVSSSRGGVTGSVYVYARRSRVEREIGTQFNDAHDDASVEQLLASFVHVKDVTPLGGSVLSASLAYISGVESRAITSKMTAALQVNRRVPTVEYTIDTGIKHAVKSVGAAARPWNVNASWSYANYHALNFMSGSGISQHSALLYPSRDRDNGHVARGELTPSGAFTIDFRVNPRYVPALGAEHRAATLLHLSSCFAVSIVSGSGRDPDGFVSAYRVLLQLSSSADVPPSTVNLRQLPDMAFVSDDNVLPHNTWSRVTVRWAGSQSRYSGTLDVNGVSALTFVVPSSSIAPPASVTQPYVLVLGNYYEGQNSGASSQAYFFSTDTSERDGLINLAHDGGGIDEPAISTFNHPMQGEVHDVSYYERWLSDNELTAMRTLGPDPIPSGCMVYVPPFFTAESPLRRSVGDHGGVLLTPFQEFDGTTRTPFNVELAFGVDGHIINLENFVRDLARDVSPRLYRLTASAIPTTTTLRTADEFLDSQYVRLANMLIMPCDDGTFVPTFSLLKARDQSMFEDEVGRHSESQIRLTDLVTSGSLLFDFSPDSSGSSGDVVTAAIGVSPEEPNGAPGPAIGAFVRGQLPEPPLTIYQRLRDGDSPRVTFFELSNLLYGSRISPGSVMLRDPALSGSGGTLRITLRDDGHGNLYRADASGSHAAWSSVGHVLYDEGIIVVKSPHLWKFGLSEYSASWRGQRPLHVMRCDAIAPAQTVNSSSNVTYRQLRASSSPSEPAEPNVYVAGVLWYDSKMNVVMKSRLAQPMLKRQGSSLTVRSKIDF